MLGLSATRGAHPRPPGRSRASRADGPAPRPGAGRSGRTRHRSRGGAQTVDDRTGGLCRHPPVPVGRAEQWTEHGPGPAGFSPAVATRERPPDRRRCRAARRTRGARRRGQAAHRPRRARWGEPVASANGARQRSRYASAPSRSARSHARVRSSTASAVRPISSKVTPTCEYPMVANQRWFVRSVSATARRPWSRACGYRPRSRSNQPK